MGSHQQYPKSSRATAARAVHVAFVLCTFAGVALFTTDARSVPKPDPKEQTFPLQVWMKANATTAIAQGNPLDLANVLDQIESFAPKEYPNWRFIAKDGAAAARANRVDAVKAACRTCHNQYRARYKLEMRDRPIPPPRD